MGRPIGCNNRFSEIGVDLNSDGRLLNDYEQYNLFLSKMESMIARCVGSVFRIYHSDKGNRGWDDIGSFYTLCNIEEQGSNTDKKQVILEHVENNRQKTSFGYRDFFEAIGSGKIECPDNVSQFILEELGNYHYKHDLIRSILNRLSEPQESEQDGNVCYMKTSGSETSGSDLEQLELLVLMAL